jgi:hypothetical protein
MQPFTAVWKYTDGDIIDYTSQADSLNSDGFNFLESTDDILILGMDRPFEGFISDVISGVAYPNLIYSYWNGTTWKQFHNIIDYTFGVSKFAKWRYYEDMALKSAVEEVWPVTGASVTVPDTTARYWIKIAASSVPTSATVIDRLRCIPSFTYTTPSKIWGFLQLPQGDFSTTTKPTYNQVVSLIRRKEGIIDYRTRKSWKWNYVQGDMDIELIDYDRFGMALRHPNLLKVYNFQMWNGGAWNSLSEGRNGDYFVDYSNGIIYITRLFLLPAAYGIQGAYYRWGFGEFKKSVRVDYAWGIDPDAYPFYFDSFPVIEEIATKMTCIDLFTTHDYSGLVSSGLNIMPIAEKVRDWNQEIEARLDELQGLIMF